VHARLTAFWLRLRQLKKNIKRKRMTSPLPTKEKNTKKNARMCVLKKAVKRAALVRGLGMKSPRSLSFNLLTLKIV